MCISYCLVASNRTYLVIYQQNMHTGVTTGIKYLKKFNNQPFNIS